MNTDDLLYLLGTFGRVAPTELCSEDNPEGRQYLYCQLHANLQADIHEAQATAQATCQADVDSCYADQVAMSLEYQSQLE